MSSLNGLRMILSLSCRESSRLLVLSRDTGEIIHSVFSEIGSFLCAGDLLVMNDTKVFPARLVGTKDSGGKAEVLLIEQYPESGRSLWIAMIDAAKKPKVGSRMQFGQEMTAEIIGDLGRGRFAPGYSLLVLNRAAFWSNL